jgi:HlyD family secretion protein
LKDNKLHALRSVPEEEPSPPSDAGIPRPKFNWKTRALIPGIIIGGFLLLLGLSAYQELVPAVSVQASPVVTKSVDGPITGAVTVQAAGWVEADPYKSFVTALADGVVREVLVLEGEAVTQGQVVARLVDEDARLAMQRAEDRVKELEATLAVERAELHAAQVEWENPVERKRAIEMGEAQLAESKAARRQIAEEIAAEEATLEHAKSQYDRSIGLRESGAISDQEFIRLHSLYNAQVSKISGLKMREAAVKQLTAKHEADLRASQQHMALRTEERRKLDRGQASVLQAEAALNQARTILQEAMLRLERMEIRSTMDGMVMSRLTEPGSKVVVISDNPGSAKVLALYDPKRMQARVDVPLADAAKISVGQDAQITVEVLPDKPFVGTVTRVLHEANIQKNTLEVKVALADPDPRLRPEMLARVKFLAKADPSADEGRHRLLVPEGAVRGTGANTTAWVLSDFDGNRAVAVSKPIKVGPAKTDGWIEIAEGLQPGDLVVAGSASELKDGKKVTVTVK